MVTSTETTAMIKADQRGQLNNVAETEIRWLITTGEAGELTVEYKTNSGWKDFGTIAAEDVSLTDDTFTNDRWVILEWTNPEHDAQYRLCAIGPQKERQDTYYTLCIQKQTHSAPDTEAYITVQRVRTNDIPTLTYSNVQD